MTATVRGMIKWVVWYAYVARGIETLLMSIHKRRTLSGYAYLSVKTGHKTGPHTRMSKHTTTTTTIRSAAWYGVSKHSLIYPCPIGNTEENMKQLGKNLSLKQKMYILQHNAKIGGK